MSAIVKIGKKGKQILRRVIRPKRPFSVSYTRRIERVMTAERVVAMTFDDGPCDLPACPDRFHGRALTDVLLDTLARYGAKGTFDVVGDTSQNYPDSTGREGGAAWGGVRYDHYPDYGHDTSGGALHCPRLIGRILDEGHQITNHGYRHILYGKKNFVYGKRAVLGTFASVLADTQALHDLLLHSHGYEITMARPPHYVDRIKDGFTAYDVYAQMGYQYLAASFDGAGWLPSAHADPDTAFRAETEAMVAPMRACLEKDPDFFCGQIIFQKDGCNMARRTPVACALEAQLALLSEYGYTVVTVNDLMSRSAFADADGRDPLVQKCAELSRNRAVAFSDNTLRLDDPMTWGELALLIAERGAVMRAYLAPKEQMPRLSLAQAAMDWCVRNQFLPAMPVKETADPSKLPAALFSATRNSVRRTVLDALRVDALPR